MGVFPTVGWLSARDVSSVRVLIEIGCKNKKNRRQDEERYREADNAARRTLGNLGKPDVQCKIGDGLNVGMGGSELSKIKNLSGSPATIKKPCLLFRLWRGRNLSRIFHKRVMPPNVES